MSELAIISVEKELEPMREKNLFLTIVISNFIWMIFHFSVVFFFMFQLKSIALVWIFLWIWNLFSFLLDISIWIIQKYFKAKTLFIFSYISEITAILIFAYFIFQLSGFVSKLPPSDMWFITDALQFFLWEWLNIFLLLVASFCYWLTKELQDITLISYVLNNANHSQYNSIFAKKNLWSWIWSLFWLILSWFILMLYPKLIIFVIIFIIILIIYFTKVFFDNSEKTITLQDIYKFKVFANKDHITELWKNIGNNIKNKIVTSVNRVELKNVISSSKYLFLKPVNKQSGLSFKLLIEQTKKEFINIYKVLLSKNNSIIIYWSLAVGATFWFWDTFAVTFLIGFLDSLWNWWWYVLLWVIAIPAFWLQGFFSKMATKYWIYGMTNIWLIVSWLSLLFMWFFADSKNILLLMSLAVINSVWYAICMSISQSLFLESYNKVFANFYNLKEIDANASAAPYKIIQNIANVLWLFFWWLILASLQYVWFFIIFWGFITYLAFWTLKNRKAIKADLQ